MTNAKEPRNGLRLVSFRNKPHLDKMIDSIKEQSGLSQSDIIRSCLVIQLPKLMEQYNANGGD